MAPGYDHIACCLDGFDGSRRALREAVRIAALARSRLSVLHAFELPPVRATLGEGGAWIPTLDESSEIARRWLVAEAAEAPEAEAVLLGPGHAPSAVCAWAGGAGVELLVAGANRTLVERVLLGNFAGFLARHAPCPVLLVRGAGRPGDGAAPEPAGARRSLAAP